MCAIELRPAEMDSFVQSNIDSKTVVLMFHVNWCGSCKRTLPEFIRTGSMVDPETTVMGHIDVTGDTSFSQDLGIDAFPAIRVLERASDPTTRVNDWISIPYYHRDAAGMAEFIARINGESSVVVESVDAVRAAIIAPRNGLVVSVLVVGDVPVEIPAKSLKHKFQFIQVQSTHIWPTELGPLCDSCAMVVPKPSVLLPGGASTLFPVFMGTPHSGPFFHWLAIHAFPGIWSVDESQFQLFNDQPVLKVFIAQDPSSSVNKTIINQLSPCMQSLAGRASVGVINGLSFSAALADFGITFTSGSVPKILVLDTKPLSYNRYYDEVTFGNICGGIADVLSGRMELKYRGGWFAKLNWKFTSFLEANGLGSDFWKSVVMFSIIGAIGLLFVGIMSCCMIRSEQIERKKRE